MRNTLTHWLMAGLVGLSVAAFGAEHPALQAFPAAKDGLERFVIVLPEKARGEEDSFRVEIIVGKDMLTDGVNLVRLAHTIETRLLAGWGYPYYEAAGSSETMSTMMAPPAGAPLVTTFVTASPIHVRYNSRLPIVVYVPTGYEVRYRIWEASETTWKADKG